MYFHTVKKILLLLFIIPVCLSAQTLGGNAVFNFLKLSHTPQLTAAGGVNVSVPANDVGMSFSNPALLNEVQHTQMNAVFNDFYGGIKNYHLSMGYHHAKLKTNFAWGLTYFDYGKTAETDAAGNILGEFRPTDWVMQVAVSRKYLEKWQYGITLKFINSSYGQFRSNGVAADVGLLFNDTAHKFYAGIVAKNMGTQLKEYPGTMADDLPFDLQIGITKRLPKAPFSFSLTAQRLHQFDIAYNDTSFNNANGFPNPSAKKFSFDKLINHFILATTIHISNRIDLQAGYNFLRRRELNTGNISNGLNGFSLGAGVMLGKLNIRYARAYYQSNTANNQLGLNLKLNEYFGLGRFGQKIGW